MVTSVRDQANPIPKFQSLVLEFPVEDQETALQHFRSKLALATDPSDVYTDLKNGETGFVVLDARAPSAYALGHVPGAINLPHRQIDVSTTASFSKNKVIVVYCDGIGCNASTKAAAKLTALGFPVKEMLGGLDWWRRDGYPIETTEHPSSDWTATGHETPAEPCDCDVEF